MLVTAYLLIFPCMQWEHRRIALEKAEDKYADKFEQKSKIVFYNRGQNC